MFTLKHHQGSSLDSLQIGKLRIVLLEFVQGANHTWPILLIVVPEKDRARGRDSKSVGGVSEHIFVSMGTVDKDKAHLFGKGRKVETCRVTV